MRSGQAPAYTCGSRWTTCGERKDGDPVTVTASPIGPGGPVPSGPGLEADAGPAYLSYRDRLFATVVRSVRDEEVAADIVQEAFLELVRAGRRGDLPENELAWLHRVAANRVIDWSRRRARWAGHVPPSEDLEEAPEAAVLRQESHRELHLALAGLSSDSRRALLLEGEGYPPAEIAILIGRTGQATRTLLCRARRRVRETLAPQPA
jgi:RNA polymerase sigma-70 factor (ECF subfamily)